MRVCEVLSRECVKLASPGMMQDRAEVMLCLAELLSAPASLSAANIVTELTAREQLQSTAIGSGVAVPHARFDSIGRQFGAMIVAPAGVEFGAIDGAPVQIILGVIGPQGQIKRHLQLLTAISRVLRDSQVRRAIIESTDGAQAFELLNAAESR